MLSYNGNSLGRASVAFGTVINRLVPPSGKGKPGFTRISAMAATAAGTAHTLTVLRSVFRTYANATGASGQATVTVAAIGAIAANDLLAIRETDNITRLYTVSSVAGSVITLTGNLNTGVSAANQLCSVWRFGVLATVDPADGNAHPTLNVPVSATTAWGDQSNGIFSSRGQDEPILVQDNNITATGAIEYVTYGYTVE